MYSRKARSQIFQLIFQQFEEAYAYEKGEVSGIKKLLPSGQPFLEIVKKEKKYETSESESNVFPQECLDLMNLKTDILLDQDIKFATQARGYTHSYNYRRE